MFKWQIHWLHKITSCQRYPAAFYPPPRIFNVRSMPLSDHLSSSSHLCANGRANKCAHWVILELNSWFSSKSFDSAARFSILTFVSRICISHYATDASFVSSVTGYNWNWLRATFICFFDRVNAVSHSKITTETMTDLLWSSCATWAKSESSANQTQAMPFR